MPAADTHATATGGTRAMSAASAPSGGGSGGGERRLFTFHLPKAWHFFSSTSGSSAAGGGSYSRLPEGEPVSAGRNDGGARAGPGNDNTDEEDEEEERPTRPSLTMSSSYMSETSIIYNDEDGADGEDRTTGALERTHAWAEASALQRLAVVLAFILLGAGVLLSFNALISPTEYFRARFRGTPYENTFSSWIVSVYNVASIVFGAHAVATLGRDSSKRKSTADGGNEEAALPLASRSGSGSSSGGKQMQIMRSSVRRIMSSGFLVVVCLFVLALSTNIRYVPPPRPSGSQAGTEAVKVPANTYFYVIMALSFVLAAAVSYLQNAVVAVCSTFGPRAMSLMLSGQGVIGLSISGVQLAAAWAQSDPAVQAQVEAQIAKGDPSFEDPATSAARIFFSTGAALMAVTLLSFGLLVRSRFWTEVLEASAVSHSRRPSAAHIGRSGSIDEHRRRTSSSNGLSRSSIQGDGDGSGNDTSAQRPPFASHQSIALLKTTESSPFLRWISPYLSAETQSSLARLWDVQAQTIVLCLTIAYIFTLTLALFPALTARVLSVGYTDTNTGSDSSGPRPARWQTPLVFAAIHFVVFNFADLVGRSLPGLVPAIFLLRNTPLLVALTVGRTLLFPLLRGCNLPTRPGHASHTPPSSSLLRTDAAFFLIVFVMGLSNGVLATSILIAGPGKVRAFGFAGAKAQPSSLQPSKSATRSAQALSATVLSYWLTLGLALGSALSFITVKLA
ncbi:hypothetical protein OC844_001253 [Tilletia horrida]|nr:hypothetical protein OC844_001253 [Tilletia horrida]